MIINSILDTDLYKFTTSYAYIKLFPYAMGTFQFIDRDETEYSEEFLAKLKTEIETLKHVCLRNDELQYMYKHCRFIPLVYWEWLSSFRFNPDQIEIYLDSKKHLHISITDLLYKATLYEVPILAIVSEVKNQFYKQFPDSEEVLARLTTKVELSNANKLPFSEFGTRRRFSFEVQDLVVGYLKRYASYCNGTSNCYLAMKYDMRPMGTHPHEWFMFHGAQFGYQHANYLAMENWINTYDGDLGIALTDTFTSDAFFNNFSQKHAKLFDGIRQDSGDEYEFVDKAIKRYLELGVNPLSKTIVFSNGLDFEKAKKISKYCKGKINCSFGIGTNLTNDVGFKAPNIVMKLTECQMNERKPIRKCVKLSDDKGKVLGDKMQIAVCLNSI